MLPDIFYWLAAIRLPAIGPVLVRRWLESNADIKALFSAGANELLPLGWQPAHIARLAAPNWPAIEEDLQWCEKNGCHIISLQDSRYPKLLQALPDAPLVLFAKGNVEALSQPQLAIVGTRNPTPIGRTTAFEFAADLSKAGLVITSGLALGTDAAGHAGALHAGGKTIAVLGAGFKHIYPASNRTLANAILDNGAWLSEFPPSVPPKAKHFPRRNRIISGASLGTLVIEAATRSGSLITARLSAEQGREVFAIPGSIHNPMSRGCHQLIRQGAKLVEKTIDIIEELGPLAATLAPPAEKNPTLAPHPLEGRLQKILNEVGFEVTPMDVIIQSSGLTAGEVSSMLLSLELKGFIQTVVGGYIRMPPRSQ